MPANCSPRVSSIGPDERRPDRHHPQQFRAGQHPSSTMSCSSRAAKPRGRRASLSANWSWRNSWASSARPCKFPETGLAFTKKRKYWRCASIPATCTKWSGISATTPSSMVMRVRASASRSSSVSSEPELPAFSRSRRSGAGHLEPSAVDRIFRTVFSPAARAAPDLACSSRANCAN